MDKFCYSPNKIAICSGKGFTWTWSTTSLMCLKRGLICPGPDRETRTARCSLCWCSPQGEKAHPGLGLGLLGQGQVTPWPLSHWALASALGEKSRTLFVGPGDGHRNPEHPEAQVCLVTLSGPLGFSCFAGGNPGHAAVPLLGSQVYLINDVKHLET